MIIPPFDGEEIVTMRCHKGQRAGALNYVSATYHQQRLMISLCSGQRPKMIALVNTL